jgi:ABC-type polysaccharide/polyol phosphate transport system ATPase subunit
VQPEVLIVDEVLSVGDHVFRAKCEERINKMIESGTTVLMVSHDIETVREICSRALLL